MPTPAAPPGDKQTTQRRATEREPQLPHERDESSASQRGEADRERIEQAARDLESGKVDTDKGPELDRAYREQKKKAT